MSVREQAAARRVKLANILYRAGFGKSNEGENILRLVDYPLPTGFSLNTVSTSGAWSVTVTGKHARSGRAAKYGMKGRTKSKFIKAKVVNDDTGGILAGGTMPLTANQQRWNQLRPADRCVIDSETFLRKVKITIAFALVCSNEDSPADPAELNIIDEWVPDYEAPFVVGGEVRYPLSSANYSNTTDTEEVTSSGLWSHTATYYSSLISFLSISYSEDLSTLTIHTDGEFLPFVQEATESDTANGGFSYRFADQTMTYSEVESGYLPASGLPLPSIADFFDLIVDASPTGSTSSVEITDGPKAVEVSSTSAGAGTGDSFFHALAADPKKWPVPEWLEKSGPTSR